MLLFQVLQDFSFLALSGLGVYAIRVSHYLVHRPDLKPPLIGLVFAGVFLLIATNTSITGVGILHFDVGLGPLFLAGAVGGPVGALIAAMSSFVVLGLDASSEPVFDTFLYIGVVVFSLLVHALGVRKSANFMSRNIALAGIAAVALAHGLAQIGVAIFASSEPLPNLLVCLVFGTAAVLVASAVIAVADSVYNTKKQAAELAYRLNMITKTGRMGIFEFRKTAAGVAFDQSIMRMLQLNGVSQDVPLSEWIEGIHADDQASLMAAIRSVAVEGSHLDQIEFRGMMPDGRVKDFQAHWVTERDPNGAFIRAVGVHMDLTEIKQSERGKIRAERWLSAIAANLPGAVMVAEKRPGTPPKLVYVSEHCKEIWGYTNQEIKDDPDLMLSSIDPDQKADMLADLKAAALGFEKLSRRCKITTKDGAVKWLDYHGNSVRVDGSYTRTDSIILDVTAEVLAQSQLREQSALAMQAQKMESIGQLTGGVAHDFNNLLAVIIGNLELLGEEVDDEDQLQMINAGVGAALRGADLTRKMLAFARRSQLETQVLDLNEIVGETRNWAGRTMPANITIETALADNIQPVEADRASTESALLNLILNARDAMPDGGRLRLETANVRIDADSEQAITDGLAPGCYVRLAVSDTGTGIDPKVLAFVFEPFYTTKAPGAGSGLGLSMVQGFMHQSGGAVRASSERGVGTTFKLFFPVGDTAAMSEIETPHATEAKPVTGGRILVAEDQSDVLEVMVQILTRAGYDVRATSSGDEAKDVFEADPHFDMLLTDIVMPGRLQGTMLARELRDIQPDLPVAFMSGYANEAITMGEGMRPDDVRLKKPVQKRDLLAAIEKLLRKTGRSA